MLETPMDEKRRLFLKGASALIFLPLAACQSALPPAHSASASMSATEYLARIRASSGLAPLAADTKLEVAAREQAGYMARTGRMTHTTGRRRDFSSRMDRNDVEGAAAENVARGRLNLDQLFELWMNSAGHRRNMLDPRFRHFGLASAAGGNNGERYWALVLGH